MFCLEVSSSLCCLWLKSDAGSTQSLRRLDTSRHSLGLAQETMTPVAARINRAARADRGARRSMSEDSALEFGSLMAKIVIVVSLFSVPALAQQTTSTSPTADPHASTLPDAPSSQDPQDGSPLREETPAVPATSSALQGPIGPVPPLWTNTPLTFKQ